MKLEILSPSDALSDWVETQLLNDIRSTQPQATNSGFTVTARSESGELAGALLGSTSYGWLLIKVLWIGQTFRRRGLGAKVVAAAEREAEARGCHGAWLDTSVPDARAFYEALGYKTFGSLENEPGEVVPEHRRWFLRRRFTSGQ